MKNFVHKIAFQHLMQLIPDLENLYPQKIRVSDIHPEEVGLCLKVQQYDHLHESKLIHLQELLSEVETGTYRPGISPLICGRMEDEMSLIEMDILVHFPTEEAYAIRYQQGNTPLYIATEAPHVQEKFHHLMKESLARFIKRGYQLI